MYLPKIHLCFCNRGDYHLWLGLLFLTIDIDYYNWGKETKCPDCRGHGTIGVPDEQGVMTSAPCSALAVKEDDCGTETRTTD